ncbi:MAG: RHS repeat-associated core domain-containing protein, partial [Bacteroidales bacterium]|nr:RHS repeat-associated core domain-containing protein [Bacteroidales bacterium]
LQDAQTLFAPEQCTGTTDVAFTFGINCSLRRREVYNPQPYTEYYLFNSAANMKAYSNNGLDVAYYGYNSSNSRTYKLSFLNTNQWVNGQPEPLDLQLQNAMFYPNAYVNFNHNGEYTKHYYNGAERIASRLGITATPVSVTANARLSSRSSQLDNRFQEDILDLMPEGVSVSSSGGVNVSSLESPTGNTTDIFYYHTNHLGSTAFVTDQNQTVTQGFLYAPFGEITTEYNATFYSNILPKYSFNAKELDEETGMYYYEARYYKPPVFTSRDAMFEKNYTISPYAYCINNPVKFIDPNGLDTFVFDKNGDYSHPIRAEGNHVGRYINSSGEQFDFTFADPVNDPKDIENGNINKAIFVSDESIKNILSNSEVFKSSNQSDKYNFIITESNASNNLQGKGLMDYVVSANFGDNGFKGLISNTLYVVKVGSEYTGHNNYNFGNFLWGAGASALGFSKIIAKIGAHINNYLNDSDNREIPWYKFYKRSFDSHDDQFSISQGFLWMKEQNKKNK